MLFLTTDYLKDFYKNICLFQILLYQQQQLNGLWNEESTRMTFSKSCGWATKWMTHIIVILFIVYIRIKNNPCRNEGNLEDASSNPLHLKFSLNNMTLEQSFEQISTLFTSLLWAFLENGKIIVLSKVTFIQSNILIHW